MQTNSIKAIKDYLKFYFASQEFVYLPPQKILAKTPNDNIAQDTIAQDKQLLPHKQNS